MKATDLAPLLLNVAPAQRILQPLRPPNGIVRNYWRPIAENLSPVCHCVETEPKIVEDKGDYIWRP